MDRILQYRLLSRDITPATKGYERIPEPKKQHLEFVLTGPFWFLVVLAIAAVFYRAVTMMFPSSS